MKLELFKTNVVSDQQATTLLKSLQLLLPDCIMNFDLEDSDNVLRIETNREIAEQVSIFFTENGVFCKRLV